MRIRTAATTASTLLILTITACGNGDTTEPKAPVSSSAASPTASQADAERACKEAWRQAVEEGAIDDGTVSVENPPAECDGVRNGMGLGAEAIREHIQEGRKQLEDCMDDPSAPECDGLPIP